MDISFHSDYETLFTARDMAPPRPLAILVWNGQRVLRRRADIQSTEWSVHDARRAGFSFHNARYLGIPMTGQSDVDPLCPYAGIEVIGLRYTNGLYTVTFVPGGPCARGVPPRNFVATLSIDPARDWAIVSYHLEGEYEAGLTYTVSGEAIYAKYGDVWFPQWLRHEQLRNGAFEWAREYQVIDARFNEPVDPAIFTWKGMGIKPRTPIVSYVSGVPHQIWDGMRAAPWSAFRSASERSGPVHEDR